MGAGPSSRARASVLAAGALFSLAAIWTVDDDGPADFSALQSAVEAVYVHSGDTILVRAGRYPGNLVLSNKDLIIVSDEGPFRTILDGQDSGSVVSLDGRTSATRIEGFTITGGRGPTGGGVWIYGGGPVVTRNIIEGNRAAGGFLGYGYGGGIEVYGGAAVITRNVIRGNTALDGGGGIDVYYAGPSSPGPCCPLIAQNTITGNVVTAATGIGGGILAFASEPHVSSCIVQGNTAVRGGGIHVEKVQGNSDAPSATHNIFFANTGGDATSNGSWRLPASNPLVDPRLGEGEWIAAWPRSDSPALDGAEPGLASWPDLTGSVTATDSDLDGDAAGDAGALEGRGEITGLTVSIEPVPAGAAQLSWDGPANGAAVLHLFGDDQGPFTTAGGTCLAAGTGLAGWTDTDTPAPGAIRFYLVAATGVTPGIAGLRSDGTPIPQPPACGP